MFFLWLGAHNNLFQYWLRTEFSVWCAQVRQQLVQGHHRRWFRHQGGPGRRPPLHIAGLLDLSSYHSFRFLFTCLGISMWDPLWSIYKGDWILGVCARAHLQCGFSCRFWVFGSVSGVLSRWVVGSVSCFLSCHPMLSRWSMFVIRLAVLWINHHLHLPYTLARLLHWLLRTYGNRNFLIIIYPVSCGLVRTVTCLVRYIQNYGVTA